ncbi:MAG: hypothetical protein ACRCSK_06400 [Fusobacteriaceae bacterium]
MLIKINKFNIFNLKVNLKFVFMIIFLVFAFDINSAPAPKETKSDAPVIDQEVRAKNLQQLEYQSITNTNEKLKEQEFSSSNMEITGDTLKRQKQKITIIQSDSLELQAEVINGEKKGFFSNLFR